MRAQRQGSPSKCLLCSPLAGRQTDASEVLGWCGLQGRRVWGGLFPEGMEQCKGQHLPLGLSVPPSVPQCPVLVAAGPCPPLCQVPRAGWLQLVRASLCAKCPVLVAAGPSGSATIPAHVMSFAPLPPVQRLVAVSSQWSPRREELGLGGQCAVLKAGSPLQASRFGTTRTSATCTTSSP